MQTGHKKDKQKINMFKKIWMHINPNTVLLAWDRRKQCGAMINTAKEPKTFWGRMTGEKRFTLISIVLFVLVFFFAMCIRTGRVELMNPLWVIENLFNWIRFTFAEAFNLPFALQKGEVVADSHYYLETISRFRGLITAMICGAGLAIGGAVFQGIFRNPMAVPTMLGVSTGIEVALLVLVLQYSTAAYSMVFQRYVWSFGAGFIVLLIVIAVAKYIGKNKTSVTDMILVASILTQVVNVICTYFRYEMEDEDLEVYTELSMYGFSSNVAFDTAGHNLLILILVFVITLLPIFLMRFSFDAMCLSEDEACSLGINPKLIRFVCLVLMTILITETILCCGTIGVLALIVPHLCRYVYGAKFKLLLVTSAFFGALVLMISKTVTSLIYIDTIGYLPMGSVVGIIAAPLLFIAILQQRRGWE